MAPCILVEVDRHFRGVYCLHYQRVNPSDKGRRISETSVYFCETSRHHMTEGCNLYTRSCQNLESHKFILH
jgi:hypothetical protein